MSKNKLEEGLNRVKELNEQAITYIKPEIKFNFINNFDYNNESQRKEFFKRIGTAAGNSKNDAIIEDIRSKLELQSREDITGNPKKFISEEIIELIAKLPVKEQNNFIELASSASKNELVKQNSLKNNLKKIGTKVKNVFNSKKIDKSENISKQQPQPVISEFTPADYNKASTALQAQQEREDNRVSRLSPEDNRRAKEMLKNQQRREKQVSEHYGSVAHKNLIHIPNKEEIVALQQESKVAIKKAELPVPNLTQSPIQQPRRDGGERVNLITKTIIRPTQTPKNEKFADRNDRGSANSSMGRGG